MVDPVGTITGETSSGEEEEPSPPPAGAGQDRLGETGGHWRLLTKGSFDWLGFVAEKGPKP